MFDLQKVDQGHRGSDTIRWPMLNSTKIPIHCVLAFIVSEILKILTFNLQKVGQGHGLKFSHIGHTKANTKIYNGHPMNLCANSISFRH